MNVFFNKASSVKAKLSSTTTYFFKPASSISSWAYLISFSYDVPIVENIRLIGEFLFLSRLVS